METFSKMEFTKIAKLVSDLQVYIENIDCTVNPEVQHIKEKLYFAKAHLNDCAANLNQAVIDLSEYHKNIDNELYKNAEEFEPVIEDFCEYHQYDKQNEDVEDVEEFEHKQNEDAESVEEFETSEISENTKEEYEKIPEEIKDILSVNNKIKSKVVYYNKIDSVINKNSGKTEYKHLNEMIYNEESNVLSKCKEFVYNYKFDALHFIKIYNEGADLIETEWGDMYSNFLRDYKNKECEYVVKGYLGKDGYIYRKVNFPNEEIELFVPFIMNGTYKKWKWNKNK